MISFYRFFWSLFRLGILLIFIIFFSSNHFTILWIHSIARNTFYKFKWSKTRSYFNVNKIIRFVNIKIGMNFDRRQRKTQNARKVKRNHLIFRRRFIWIFKEKRMCFLLSSTLTSMQLQTIHFNRRKIVFFLDLCDI